MEETTTAVLDPQVEIDLETPPIGGFPGEQNPTSRLLSDIFKSVLATLIIFALMVTYIAQGFKVYGKCMEPNLVTGERLLGNKFIYRFREPSRGDVVIFRYPRDPSKTYIKRVIAHAGETVEIKSGKVFINNRQLNESYVKNIPHGDYGPEKVQAGNLFVLGDNRDFSNDSRFWGPLPEKDIQAKAWLRYWPLERMDVLK